MVGFATLSLIAGSAVWVYWDASRHGIGDISQHKPEHRFSAASWAFATMFVWPLALPAYLIARPRLIVAACVHPVEERCAGLKMAALAVIGIAYVTASVVFSPVARTPNAVASSRDETSGFMRTMTDDGGGIESQVAERPR